MPKPIKLVFHGAQLPCIHGNVRGAPMGFGAAIDHDANRITHLIVTCLTCSMRLDIPVESLEIILDVGEAIREGAKA